MGCAHATGECGKEVRSYYVECKGFAGETCKTNDECATHAGFKCAMDFDKVQLKFTDGTNKCIDGTMCGKDKAPATNNDTAPTLATVCYDTHLTGCDANTTCKAPEGDNGTPTCAYFQIDGAKTNLSSGGMCMDNAGCNTDNATAGKDTMYFGTKAKLICEGGLRTGLALGAAVVSAYLAM